MSSSAESIYPQGNINSAKSNGHNGFVEFDRFRLDPARLMLYENGQPLALAPKVIETLLALVERRGEVVGKDELMNRLWPDSFVEEANLTQNIYLLRKTLGDGSDGKPLIETFRRRGYRFNGEIKMPTDASDESIAHPKIEIRERSNLLPIAVGVVLIGIAVPVVWLFVSRQNQADAAPPKNISYQRLTPYLNVFSPAVSPDGKYFAYTLVEDAGHSIWVKEIAGGKAAKITPSIRKSFRFLRFAPNSRDIFYLNENNVLARLSVAGGESVETVRGLANPFAISPDGSRVAFVRGREMVVANIDGGERVLSRRDGESSWYSSHSAQPAWSPDGATIFVGGGYREKGQKSAELIAIDATSGAERRVPTPAWDEIQSVAWAEDGSGLFVIARERITSPSQIWRLPYPYGTPERITNDLNSYNWLSFSADTRLMATEQVMGACNVWIGPAANPNDLAQLTFSDRETTGRAGLAIAPDGSVIFSADYSGNLDIWKIDPDGQGLRQLTANAGDWNGRQQITNDGRYAVFMSRREGTKRAIWRARLDGSDAVPLTQNGYEDYPAVSPDGNWVYYTDVSGEVDSIWKVPIDGGASVRVTGDYVAVSPSVSPDGKRIAFLHGQKGGKPDALRIAVTDADGGEPRVFDEAAFREIVRWSPDGESLMFIKKGSPNLWRLPLDGSSATELTKFDLETTWNFALSQDGQKIAFTRGNVVSEAVLITEFR